MLYLQSRAQEQQQVKQILDECQARIQSMAIVHQNLYGEQNAGTLDFSHFLQSLFAELSNSFQPNDNEIVFEVTGSCPPLNISQSIALGLVMNELVTNSLKYAFAENEEGLIRVDLQVTGDRLQIRYSDNGAGLKKPFDLSAGGFGFRLIDILTRQLNAGITYRRENGESAFLLVLQL
jgi:two-component sensor histidine kinase